MQTVNAKVVILGSQGVGKTALVTRYENHTFTTGTSATIGASYSHLHMTVDNCRVNMQVWDTAGQERFRSLAPMYYRNANAALLVFDLTSRSSFAEAKEWSDELLSNVETELVLVLLGNKLDLADQQRAVSRAEALLLADQIEAVYFEASALANDGVAAAFEHIGLMLAKRVDGPENMDLSRLSTVNLDSDDRYGYHRHNRHRYTCC